MNLSQETREEIKDLIRQVIDRLDKMIARIDERTEETR